MNNDPAVRLTEAARRREALLATAVADAIARVLAAFK